jgi:oxygen-independent coproporphyrinogen-3 oxidase
VNALKTPPLGLYIHLPWCVRKCPYCDFNSHKAPEALPEARYIDALLADLDQELPGVLGREVVSVFLGGGTPSLFSGPAIQRLLIGVGARMQLADDAEITMEVNPGTLECAPLDQYRAAGINRLSLGVQSFDDQQLERIGRIHSATDARNAVEQALAVGFDRVNLDLMYGLPGQTSQQALADLDQAIELGPDHVSHYQLTIEPNTLFHAHRPAGLPDHDLAWDMQTQGQRLLDTAGYQQYEISAYARSGAHCRHNLNYWQFGDYLGIGAGAHGKITHAADGRIERSCKQRHPASYLERAGAEPREGERWLVPVDDRRLEFVLNAFRLNQGVPLKWYPARTGLTLDPETDPWATALDRGWLSIGPEGLEATNEGRRLLNDLQSLFLV